MPSNYHLMTRNQLARTLDDLYIARDQVDTDLDRDYIGIEEAAQKTADIEERISVVMEWLSHRHNPHGEVV